MAAWTSEAPCSTSCSAAAHHGAGGVDHVVDQHADATFDLADDVAGLDRVLRALDPALVDDGEVGVELVGVLLGHLHPAGVGRDHHEVVAELAHGVDEHGAGHEVVDRAVEEALDLAGVQVDGDEAGGAGGGEHVGDELRGDGLAALGLAVLAGVAVEGADRRRCAWPTHAERRRS